MKKLFPFLFFLFTINAVFGQTMISFKEANPYDENRYAEIKSSPYFFDTFVKGWIRGSDGAAYDPVQMNYNGYTHSFEVRQGDRFISLSPQYYSRIALLPEGATDTIVFARGLHPGFRDLFVQEVYQSDQIILAKHFEVGLTENTKNVPGGFVEVKRFSRRSTWYLIDKSEGTRVKLEDKKKKLIKSLGHSKELNDFLKENKEVDTGTDTGMRALIQEWERLEF